MIDYYLNDTRYHLPILSCDDRRTVGAEACCKLSCSLLLVPLSQILGLTAQHVREAWLVQLRWPGLWQAGPATKLRDCGLSDTRIIFDPKDRLSPGRNKVQIAGFEL